MDSGQPTWTVFWRVTLLGMWLCPECTSVILNFCIGNLQYKVDSQSKIYFVSLLQESREISVHDTPQVPSNFWLLLFFGNLSSVSSLAPTYCAENLRYVLMNESIVTKNILIYSYIWPNPHSDKLKFSLNAFVKTNWKSF